MTSTRDDLAELSRFAWSRLDERLGGAFADSTRRAFALHILDELIHHGAEVALLRDLYRAWPG
jgi:hypothetical protein